MSNHLLPVSSERAATLDARESAALVKISQRHWWALNQRGCTPAPIRLGRSVRWSRDELLAWVSAGAPTREQWLALKARKGAPTP